MIVEVCTNSLISAINAENAGANRIELCTTLEVGGITPSYGLLKIVKEQLKIPVHVLIRPHSGHFSYSTEAFEVMKNDLVLCKEMGCEGIVSGVLNKDYTIDIERTAELIDLATPMCFTFHRAFDWTPDPFLSIEQLIDLGCKRVLTSGQQPNALLGLDLLTQLQKKFEKHIEIMPGGGINTDNILMFKQAKFKSIHFSANSKHQITKQNPRLSFNNNIFDERYTINSDYSIIQKMLSKVL